MRAPRKVSKPGGFFAWVKKPQKQILYFVRDGTHEFSVEDSTQRTSTRTSETSSTAGPSRHSATRSRMPCFISLKGQQGRLAHEFLHAWNSQHFACDVENIGDAVGVEHDAVAGFRVPLRASPPRPTASGSAPSTMLRDSSSRGSWPGRHDHARRVPGAGENHPAAVAARCAPLLG